jgi:1,4-dihydroxy-2-naphthoyl-CoA hydrolase
MEENIWYNKQLQLTQLQGFGKNNLGAHLGMEFVELGPNFLKGTLPVDDRTRQPFGLLHGGASVALAETLGSVASALVVDSNIYMCVGLEINANHLRPVRKGLVTGTCTPIHLGKTTHVWDIKIHDERGKLTCISRHTVAIIKK